jgi:ATP-dependent DNA helicase DinG
VPALLCGGKVIITTASKTLQDQLYNKDLPTMMQALGIPAQISLLKGRNNYICQYYLQEEVEYGNSSDAQEIKWLRNIDKFSKNSVSGDKTECVNVPENANIWHRVTANKDTCLGSKCGYYNSCFMVQARKNALLADIVVVNHHLFIADLMLKQNDIELLPKSNVVIFDEAHHLPEIATNFFGYSISTSQISNLCSDVAIIGHVHCADVKWSHVCQKLDKKAKDTRLTVDKGKYQFHDLEKNTRFFTATKELFAELEEFSALLSNHSSRHEEMARFYERSQELLSNLNQWQQNNSLYIYWIDVGMQSLTWHSTPLDISKQFAAHQHQTWVFTSATIAVQNKFDHFIRELGLDLPLIDETKDISTSEKDAQNILQNQPQAINPLNSRNLHQICIDSPFDYQKSLLYIPKNMPDASDIDFNQRLINHSWASILSSGGHALILCTTLRGVEQSAIALDKLLKQHNLDWPLLVQGQSTRSRLLQEFKTKPNSILIGSQSFWEGVDIRGEALKLVIIDKIPFATPDDPVNAGKIRHLKQQHVNAFKDYQIPQASITLQQGAGRLIRSESDTGVLIIGDKRIVEKSYGKSLLLSLPKFKITRNEDDVIGFFK